jgi:ketosteroid isomerase-like protein
MYKAAARWMIKRNIAKLNTGDYGPTLAMYTDASTLTFPGDNSWATMFRPHERGRDAIPTHRGRTEIEAFLRRYTEHGLQMVVDDILVNGPPWNARAAVRCHDWAPGDDGGDAYNNRAVMWVTTRWGRIVEHEDYEDTERSAAYDALIESRSTPSTTTTTTS